MVLIFSEKQRYIGISLLRYINQICKVYSKSFYHLYLKN